MRKWKNVVTVCTAIMMSISLAACADREENGGVYTLEPQEITTESLNGETDKESQEMESPETEFLEDAVPEEKLDTGREDAGRNGSGAADDNVDKAANATEGAGGSGEANTASPEPAETPAVEQQTQNVPASSATIVGTIKSLSDGSFSISRADVNSKIMVSTDETVNVVYSDSTEFEVCTSSDGGITANYATGTSADLQTGRLVNIVGAYEGSDFVAQKITIEIFG